MYRSTEAAARDQCNEQRELWKQLRQKPKRRLDGRLSQTGLFTSEDRTKTRRSILPTSLPSWCVGSLYRLLFGSCTYHQADLAGEPNLHFEHSAASLLPRELKDNDFVLSTQVLKHVENSANCLQECYRVLKPGAHLLLLLTACLKVWYRPTTRSHRQEPSSLSGCRCK